MLLISSIFEDLFEKLTSIWEFFKYAWNMLLYIADNFGVTIILDLSLSVFGFLLGLASNFMPSAVSTYVDQTATFMQGPIFSDVMAIIAWIADFFVHWEYVDASLGLLLVLWAVAIIVRLVVLIFSYIWPGAGSAG